MEQFGDKKYLEAPPTWRQPFSEDKKSCFVYWHSPAKLEPHLWQKSWQKKVTEAV